jgi:hypothetical protein
MTGAGGRVYNSKRYHMGYAVFVVQRAGRMSNLRRIETDKLAEILRRHALWLRHEEGGERANLVHADLIHKPGNPVRSVLRTSQK